MDVSFWDATILGVALFRQKHLERQWNVERVSRGCHVTHLLNICLSLFGWPGSQFRYARRSSCRKAVIGDARIPIYPTCFGPRADGHDGIFGGVSRKGQNGEKGAVSRMLIYAWLLSPVRHWDELCQLKSATRGDAGGCVFGPAMAVVFYRCPLR